MSTEQTKIVRAAIYARISSDREGEALGVARQEKDCRRLCADRGWVVADVYTDNDISATDRRKVRKEHKRLLSDMKAGRVDALAVWDLDRLTRQPAELEDFVKLCDEVGITQLDDNLWPH